MRHDALILSTALSLAAFACGGKEPAPAPTPTPAPAPTPTPTPEPTPEATPEPAKPTETTEVVLWHSYRAGEEAAFEKTVAAFNAQDNGVRIRSQAIPSDPFVDKVTITVPRGQGPDLFIFAHNMIGNWVEKGVLEPLSGKVDQETLKQFVPEAVKAMVYRKNLYGLPLAFKSLVS
jgi:arabinogalactan oligomer/maltooligosaccharide transport system substrate-binding protein